MPARRGGRRPRAAAFIWHDARVGEAGSVVDGDVDVFVAGTAGVIALAVAGDAMADALDPGKFLDVEVDEFARVLAAIAHDGREGDRAREAMQLVGTQEARDRGPREAALACDRGSPASASGATRGQQRPVRRGSSWDCGAVGKSDHASWHCPPRGSGPATCARCVPLRLCSSRAKTRVAQLRGVSRALV